MELLEVSLVLVQKIEPNQHNQLHFLNIPTLDFLLRKHIIKMDAEWDVDDELPMEDPLNKTILFKNKIRISASFEKLIIQQDYKSKDSLEDISKIAVKIIEKSPDIKFGGVGVNFVSISECENPGEEINNRFLQNIPQLPTDQIVAGSFSYVYLLEEARVTINVSPVKRVKEIDVLDKAIGMNANYHLDNEFPKKIQGFLRNLDALKSDYLKQQDLLFKEIDG